MYLRVRGFFILDAAHGVPKDKRQIMTEAEKRRSYRLDHPDLGMKKKHPFDAFEKLKTVAVLNRATLYR